MQYVDLGWIGKPAHPEDVLSKSLKTNMRQQHRPTQTHCMVCGSQLLIEHPRRVWLRGLIDRRGWQAVMACPKCGVRSGGGRSSAILFGHHSRNPVKRFIVRLLQKRRTGRLSETMAAARPPVDGDGNLDLGRYLATPPFPVYGLSDRPMGLRLKSAGMGSRDGLVYRFSLGYVSGDPYDPEKAVVIDQGSSEEYPHGLRLNPGRAADFNLSSIRNLIANYAPKGLRGQDPFFGDFHRDWNIERIENTPRQQGTIRVGSDDVEAQFISWETPLRITLVHLELKTNSLSVAALNLSWDDLREVLSSLVVLLDDQDALATQNQDLIDNRRLRKERYRSSHGDGHES